MLFDDDLSSLCFLAGVRWTWREERIPVSTTTYPLGQVSICTSMYVVPVVREAKPRRQDRRNTGRRYAGQEEHKTKRCRTTGYCRRETGLEESSTGGMQNRGVTVAEKVRCRIGGTQTGEMQERSDAEHAVG